MNGCREDMCENCGAALVVITPEPNDIIEIDIKTGKPMVTAQKGGV
jgi:hypothetical protein